MKLETQLIAAHHAGRVEVMAFGIREATEYHQLTEILNFIKAGLAERTAQAIS